MSNSKGRIPSADEIREAFHRVGLRPSAASRSLVQLLAIQRMPLSCMDIIRELAPYGFEESTFPRLLARMHKAGLVSKTHNGGSTVHFLLVMDALLPESRSS